MKKLLSALSIFLMVLYSNISNAHHVGASEISYQWVSDSTYRIIVKLYSDCTGAPEPVTQQLCVYNGCTSSSFFINISKSNETILNVFCPGLITKCLSPAASIPGYKEYVYSGLVTLPMQCNSWKFVCNIGPRYTTNNLNGPYSVVEAVFDNTGSKQGNSSPYSTAQAVRGFGVNKPSGYNSNCVDPNGDSIIIEVTNPLDGSSCVTYYTGFTSPYNLSNPFPTNNTFSYNPQSGFMFFTPSLIGSSRLPIKIKEYRNNSLIGYTTREMLFNVIADSPSTATTSVVPSTLVGAQLNNNIVYGCVKQPLGFCIDTKSSYSASKLFISDDHGYIMPGSSLSYSAQGTDSIRACVNWVPSDGDTGLHYFHLYIFDSSCMPPAFIYNFTVQTIPVYVWPKTTILNDTGICPGGLAFLKAVNGGSYTWIVLSGTPGSLNCFSCPQPVANPTATTQYIVSSGVNSYCANSSKDTVTVTQLTNITPLVSVTANPSMPVYPWDLVMFTATPVNGGTNPKYQWRKNGFDIAGATAPNYSVAGLQTGDTICCVLSSSEPCPLPKSVSSCITAVVFAGIGSVNKEKVNIYPNPVNNELVIEGASVNARLQLFDLLGREVYNSVVGNAKQTVNTKGLVNGTYLLKLTNTDGARVIKTIVKE